MLRRVFFKWATSAAVTAVVGMRQFSPLEIPFAGGVELEPTGEQYEVGISSVLGALDQWNLRRDAAQGGCKVGAATVNSVCGRGRIGCSVVHPDFSDDMFRAEHWKQAEEKWVLELKLRDGEERKVDRPTWMVDRPVNVAAYPNLKRRGKARRGFWGGAYGKGQAFFLKNSDPDEGRG